MKRQYENKLIYYSQCFTERFIQIVLFFSVIFGIISIIFGLVFEMKEVISVKGSIEPTNAITVKAPFSGKVEAVFIKDGEKVKKGDVLLKLNTNELIIQKLKLQSELVSLKSELEKKIYENKLKLKNNELEIQTAKSDIKTLKSRIKSLKRALFRANKRTRSLIKLERKGLVAKKELNNSINERDNTRIRLKNAEADLLKTTKIDEVSKIKESTFKQTDSIVIKSLNQIIKSLNEHLQIIELKLSKSEIKAKESGFIAGHQLDKITGNYINQGNEIFLIIRDKKWRLNALLQENEIIKVKNGLNAEINLLAFSSMKFDSIKGILNHIQYLVTENNKLRGYPVTISLNTIPQNYKSIRPGMMGEARIIVRSGTIFNVLWHKFLDSLGRSV